MEMLEMHCIFFLEGLQGTAVSAWPPQPSLLWCYPTTEYPLSKEE